MTTVIWTMSLRQIHNRHKVHASIDLFRFFRLRFLKEALSTKVCISDFIASRDKYFSFVSSSLQRKSSAGSISSSSSIVIRGLLGAHAQTDTSMSWCPSPTTASCVREYSCSTSVRLRRDILPPDVTAQWRHPSVQISKRRFFQLNASAAGREIQPCIKK